jgi:A1 cistron-splicing factor AAR2
MPPRQASQPTSAIILFHSLPQSAFLGLDLLSLTTSPNLYGIKNIPPGHHFLYSSSDPSLSIRHGRWFHIPAPPAADLGAESEPYVLVWRWSREEECLVRESDAHAAGKARANLLGRVWERGLLNYAQHASGSEKDVGELSGDWGELAGCITDETLDRVLGADQDNEGRTIGGWNISSVSSAPQDVEEIPGLTASESIIEGEKDLHFLPVDLKKTWREGAVGRERTDAARDRSWYLGHLIEQAAVGYNAERKAGAKALLGELQLCFLMVLTLANWSCLEQWKRILGVFLSCRKALVDVEDYFVAVVRSLGLQLKHCEDVEGGLFDFKEEGAGWLRGMLTQFGNHVDEGFAVGDGEKLKAELRKMEEYMRNEYEWQSGKDMLKRGLLELEDGERVDMEVNGADEEDETGEYAPVIVDLR